MNRKQKKELLQHQSTRQLMGIARITPHGIRTETGERVFYLIRPDNLSVLSPEVIRSRIRSLTVLLSTQPSLELLALDSRESFQQNKEYYCHRMEEETAPEVRALLERDLAHLDAIQFASASSREFVLVLPVDRKAGVDEATLRQLEKTIHCAVYLDIAADSPEKLRAAREVISAQLMRSRIGTDSLLLRQKDGFASANPAGGSVLASFAERVLPARSVANLYPMNYSGKTDPEGFFIGRDRFGANIIVDLFRRAPDKTNSNVLILGNSGQGKSFLLKLLLCNVREAGKSVISLDSEHEMEDECRALGGCFLDYLSGQYRINLLEPRCWDDGSGPDDPDAPQAFHGTLLAQHISFLRDVFRVYKGFDTPHIDTLELMVEQLYKKWNITDHTDFTKMCWTNCAISFRHMSMSASAALFSQKLPHSVQRKRLPVLMPPTM